jgi:hypothetical protein
VKQVKKIFLVAAMLVLALGISNAYALIDSSVVFDIAWSGMAPVDTTWWGTQYQVNPGDQAAYDGMLEYEVTNWSSSTASIRRFELMFPAELFTSQVAILGTPAGWDVGVDTNASGSLMIWGRSNTNEILPGQKLGGFLVDFSTDVVTPGDVSQFAQAYDVYARTYVIDGEEFLSAQHGKGITTPVPEPMTVSMLGLGILGLFGLRKRA